MFTNEEIQLIRTILDNQNQYFHRYSQKKSNGKYRTIVAPKPEYKLLQSKITYWLKSRNAFKVHNKAYAWIKGRNSRQCVQSHIKQRYVCEIDIRHYFNAIKDKHLIGLFVYNDRISELLNILKIDLEMLVNFLTVDSYRYGRYLAQGFTSSPYIANAIRYPLDVKMEQLAIDNNWNFTIYGDNYFLSGDKIPFDTRQQVWKLLNLYGFSISKYKVMPYYQRQQILGMTINQQYSVPKDFIRQLYIDMKNNINTDSLKGKINYLRIADNKRNYKYFNEELEKKWHINLHKTQDAHSVEAKKSKKSILTYRKPIWLAYTAAQYFMH